MGGADERAAHIGKVDTTQASPTVIKRRASRRWNDDQLREAIIGADHYSEVAKKLGLYPTTKNYLRLSDRAAILGLDTSRIEDYSSRRVNPTGPIGLLDAVTDEDLHSSWPVPPRGRRCLAGPV